jgi:predicted permease
MAMWLMHLASEIRMPFPMPLQFDLAPDTRVFVFTLALTAFTGLAFGLVPALQATRPDLTPALKEGGTVQLRRYRRISLRNALVLSQLAGSLALLLITGFLVLGHRRIAGVDVGFDARGLYLISIDPIRDGYSSEQAAAFFPKLLDRVKRLPSVRAATLTDSVPMGVIGKPGVPFLAAGRNAEDPQAVYAARRYVVGADYLETLGIPILAGRGFRREDEAPGSTAAIVNDRWECWKGQDPLGRRLQMGNEEVPEFRLGGVAPPPRRTFPAQGRKLEVVGVAKGVREGLDITAKGPPVIYMPLRPADYARPTLNGLILMVRAAPGADAIGAVRREIAAMDANLTPFNARSMPEQIEQMMLTVNSALWTYGCIGICGLILASVGLAGVTAYSVTQRRREIGIRMAMGARSVDVLGLVMKEGGTLVVVGTAIGLACAWAGMRMLASVMSMYARVSGTSATEPALLAGAPLLLAALALAACYVPARKSMRIDPAITLRQE